jgi:uncharacterized membrane protein SpoIIM required for sporulation
MIVYSSWFPFGQNTDAIALWPFIFVRKGRKWNEYVERHERIHLRQQEEVSVVAVMLAVVLVIAGCGWWSLLVLPLYYYLYGIMYIIKGYDNAFEREAYNGQWQEDYLKKRKFWQWVKYF